jgi:hypothetical protein
MKQVFMRLDVYVYPDPTKPERFGFDRIRIHNTASGQKGKILTTGFQCMHCRGLCSDLPK